MKLSPPHPKNGGRFPDSSHLLNHSGKQNCPIKLKKQSIHLYILRWNVTYFSRIYWRVTVTVFISYFVHLLCNVCSKDLSTRPCAKSCGWRDKIVLAFEEFTVELKWIKYPYYKHAVWFSMSIYAHIHLYTLTIPHFKS